MKKTNQTEVKIFKKVYCKDKGARQRMLQDFEVAIEDIEEKEDALVMWRKL